MSETVRQIVNRVFREHRRYTGDGLPGEPTSAPLPVGDPQSGPFNAEKSDLRDGLGQVGDDIETARDATFTARDASAASATLSDARADDAASFAGYRNFKDVAILLANTSLDYGGASGVAEGDIIRTRTEGFSYEVAASAATDHDVETAGGVKLYALPIGGEYLLGAWGLTPGGTADNTATVNAAIQSLVSGTTGQSVLRVDAAYSVHGEIVIPTGVTVFCASRASRYYLTQPVAAQPAGFYKPDVAGVATSAVVTVKSGGALVGGEISNRRSGTAFDGVVRVFEAPGNHAMVPRVLGVSIFGVRTGSKTAADRCFGFKVVGRALADPTFGGRYDIKVQECDVGAYLGSQFNANQINLETRECLIHLEMDGGASELIENNITLTAYNMAVFAGVEVLKTTGVVRNNYINLVSECYGQTWNIDDGIHSDGEPRWRGNVLIGSTNESTASAMPYPDKNTYLMKDNYAMTGNLTALAGIRKSITPTRTDGVKYSTGEFASFRRQFKVDGTLPELLGNGSLVAGGVNNRVICELPNGLGYAQKNSYHVNLKVFANAPFGAGEEIVRSEFVVRKVDTTSGAMELVVLGVMDGRKATNPYITGLLFISGKTAVNNARIALVGGNYAANAFTKIFVDIEITAMAFDGNQVSFSSFTDMMSTTTQAVTAADVADGLSLLSPSVVTL